MVQKGGFSILPKEIKYDKRLKGSLKVLYAELVSYSSRKGYCYATNGHFAELYGVAPVTVSRWVNKLKSLGYISSEIEYKKGDIKSTVRKIYINKKYVDDNSLNIKKGLIKNDKRGLIKNDKRGLIKNDKQNRYSNNYISNSNSKDDLLKLIITDSILRNNIIERTGLNEDNYKTCVTSFIDHASISESKLKDTLENKSVTEIKEWFYNWIKKQDINQITIGKRENINKIIDWYLDVFNRISNRGFKNKKGLEDGLLLAIDVNEYKGYEILLAIKNLYRNDDKNKFHRENGFKNITPQYLLKENNMDKYLNLFPDRIRELNKLNTDKEKEVYAIR